jgi:SAM-dependent methyltransferase
MPELFLSSEFWELQRDTVKAAGVILDLGGGTPFSGPVKEGDPATGSLYLSLDRCVESSPHVAGDVLSLPFAEAAADLVISCAVLEHLADPQAAVDEMHRVLRPGGCALGYAPFMYPWHGSPGDYWRFTGDALRHLFGRFDEITLFPCGNYSSAALGFLAGFSLPVVRFLGGAADFVGRATVSLTGRRGSRRRKDSYSRTALGHYFRAVR